MADRTEAARATSSALSFLDLPAEVQQDIVSQCSQADLICVALVSRRFRELAAAQLYRNFHIVFPDDDDINFESPIDGLAGGLDTFTTSDYNYARHLKDLSMDTLSAGIKGEQSYQAYLYSSSCGKFFNTLLYLMLRRAKSIETFRWNIRVEMSRQVYRELHGLVNLKRLHIRMQAGESYYSPPPPLPVSAQNHSDGHSTHWASMVPSSTSPPQSMPNPFASSPPSAVPLRSPSRSRLSKRGASYKHPRTLAGFKNLQNLSILDIDDTELVNELQACVRNSAGHLKELHLSFSDALAQQARPPNLTHSDPEDSDPDDDFALHDQDSGLSSAPARIFRAQEQRKVQDAILGKILGVEPVLHKKRNMQSMSEPGPSTANADKSEDDESQTLNDAKDNFVKTLKSVAKQLMVMQTGSSDFSPSQLDVLDTIHRAAQKYVDHVDETLAGGEDTGNGEGSGNTDAVSDQRPVSSQERSSSDATLRSAGSGAGRSEEKSADQEPSDVAESSSSAAQSKSKNADAVAEDIDIEHLNTIDDTVNDESDDQRLNESSNYEKASAPHSSKSDAKASPVPSPLPERALQRPPGIVALEFSLTTLQEEADALASRIHNLRLDDPEGLDTTIEEAEDALFDLNSSIASTKLKLRKMEQRRDGSRLRSASEDVPATSKAMNDYIRQTRGLALESLSIHLIPVKPSVLSRSINLHCLRQLTLLNVGNQAPIWYMLARENKVQPLALRSVHTDNVSPQFIVCMAHLHELHELFMLHRSAKQRPESDAPPEIVGLDHIRRHVLAKHMGKLKRLMIKNETNGTEWDINEKTMVLICSRGARLEELAVSMNIHAVHAFMQYFSGLVRLRALNILHFRNNDTCIWVMREILRFIVDNLSHHPNHKLEWIAMENDRVDRIIRPSKRRHANHGDHDPSDSSDEGEGSFAKKAKKKSGSSSSFKAKGLLATLDPNETYPILPSIELDSESESDEDMHDNGARLRFKTVGPLQFYDTWGVKIFDKEIRSGKL